MKILMVLTSAMLLTSSAFAGSANVEIKCQSASGRTNLEANVPGDITETLVKLSVDGKSVTYMNQDLVTMAQMNGMEVPAGKIANIATINRLDLKVFAIDISTTGKELTENNLQLVADAKTIKISVDNGNSTKASFKAKLLGLDPRDLNTTLREIELACSYDYSI